MHEFRAQRYLEALSVLQDETIDLGLSAVAMAAVLHKYRSLDRYINHLNTIADEVGMRHKALMSGGAQDDAGTRLAALKFVLSDTYDYRLCDEGAEIFDAADIVRVIDSRKGCAAVICILYMRTAQVQGWEIEGLRFPSYFLCRIGGGSQRIIFDPAQGCKALAAHDLRALVKEKKGADAELSAGYLVPPERREILIHVFNMIKSRQIEMGDYAAALETISIMRQVDPQEYRLWLDCGVLYMKTGEFRAARADLEAFVAQAPAGRDRHEAMLLLDEIRNL